MSTCFSLYLDGLLMAPQSIISFKVTVSMRYLLPIGELKLNDKGGDFIASLGAKIGSLVTVQLKPGLTSSDGKQPTLENAIESTKEPVSLVQLIVCRITGNNKQSQESMGGDVVLSLAHPWSIFKSYENHAYPATSLSNTVKTVVEDNSRGYPIEIGTIESTDDSAGTPSYKCGISDDAFLQQLLSPFLISSAHPMYSFIDDYGKYNLRTFENIYSTVPTIALVPNQIAWIGISEEYCKQNPTIKEIANYDNVSLDIGGNTIKDMLKALSPKIFFEDTVSGSVKSGILRKTFNLNATNKLPISKAIMDMGPISGCNMYQYRTMEDSIGLMHNSTRYLNELISLEISSTFVGPQMSVGTPVNLCVCSTDVDKENTYHWLNGRFVVMEKTYYSDGEMLEAKMLTTIAKPVIEITNTTVKNANTLYVGA